VCGTVFRRRDAGEAVMANNKCKNCRFPMTWAQQCKQFGRLKKLGYSDSQIKDCLPRCQKCVTVWKKGNQPHDIAK
jgi:hypothetical protein